MRKLSKYEKETIINWNEGETIASIYTFNASLNTFGPTNALNQTDNEWDVY